MRSSMMWSAGAGAAFVHPRGAGTRSLSLCAPSAAGTPAAARASAMGIQTESDCMASDVLRLVRVPVESLDLRLGEVLAIALVERVAGRVLRATTGESGMRRALT